MEENILYIYDDDYLSENKQTFAYYDGIHLPKTSEQLIDYLVEMTFTTTKMAILYCETIGQIIYNLDNSYKSMSLWKLWSESHGIDQNDKIYEYYWYNVFY